MNRTTTGECETCERTEVRLTLMHHNMMMCESCIADEKAITERNAHASRVIESARTVDASVELKQDLFNAATVSFIELQAAIENNDGIPAERKNFSLMTEVAERIQKLDAVIFADEAALTAKKNERHALLVNAQNVAARLHETERIKFKQYDVNYKPVAPKSLKPKVVKVGKKFDKAALYEAAKKYGVPAPQVQSIIISRNMSAEDAAKHLAELLGLI